MSKEKKELATELNQVKLYLRRIERDATRLKLSKSGAAIDQACKSLDVAVLAVQE